MKIKKKTFNILKDILKNSHNIDPEYVDLVNKNFWNL